MMFYLVKTDGTIEQRETTQAIALDVIKRAIGADTIDTVNLRDGRVMIVDDNGYETRAEHTERGVSLVPVQPLKLFNPSATRLYWSVCKPGTHHRIVGDVAIANDVDFDNSTHVTGFRRQTPQGFAAPVIPDNGKSEQPTPALVHCRAHGRVFLTPAEYDRQMSAPDGGWVCPVCLEDATWDDENYEEHMTRPAGEAPGDDPPTD